jgi:hypothetical protein
MLMHYNAQTLKSISTHSTLYARWAKAWPLRRRRRRPSPAALRFSSFELAAELLDDDDAPDADDAPKLLDDAPDAAAEGRSS